MPARLMGIMGLSGFLAGCSSALGRGITVAGAGMDTAVAMAIVAVMDIAAA